MNILDYGNFIQERKEAAPFTELDLNKNLYISLGLFLEVANEYKTDDAKRLREAALAASANFLFSLVGLAKELYPASYPMFFNGHNFSEQQFIDGPAFPGMDYSVEQLIRTIAQITMYKNEDSYFQAYNFFIAIANELGLKAGDIATESAEMIKNEIPAPADKK